MHQDYVNDNTCWVSYDALVGALELLPLALLTALSVIICEATGMRRFPKHVKARLRPIPT